MIKIRLVKVEFHPVFMADSEENGLEELDHPVVTLKANEWNRDYFERFLGEVKDWEDRLNGELRHQ